MLQILSDVIEGDKRTITYTQDGVNVSHVVETLIGGTVENLPIPKDPVLLLRERVEAMEELQNELLLGGFFNV